MNIAIVIAPFYEDITQGLLSGVREVLSENRIELNPREIYNAPGAFEIPLIAQTLAETRRYDGVICLGCVVKGETAHFEFISLAASMGLMESSLKTSTPISFGILTVYEKSQADKRSEPGPHNKGREAATACLSSIHTLRRILQDNDSSPAQPS